MVRISGGKEDPFLLSTALNRRRVVFFVILPHERYERILFRKVLWDGEFPLWVDGNNKLRLKRNIRILSTDGKDEKGKDPFCPLCYFES